LIAEPFGFAPGERAAIGIELAALNGGVE